MPVPTYTVSCLSKERITPDVYAFTLAKPAGFTFQAGQFVLFDVALVENPADVQTRAFSIASSNSEDTLLFVAKMKQGGRASRWIEEILDVKSEVVMKGPFGNFTVKDPEQAELVFIATSTGVAPFRGQILDLLASGFTKRIDLIFGVRAESDMFWMEEWKLLSQKYENLFVHLALSQPSDDWTGHRGRVQTLVPLIIKDFTGKQIYVCGSPDMTKEVKQLCLETWGIEKQNLHVEGYI